MNEIEPTNTNDGTGKKSRRKTAIRLMIAVVVLTIIIWLLLLNHGNNDEPMVIELIDTSTTANIETAFTDSLVADSVWQSQMTGVIAIDGNDTIRAQETNPPAPQIPDTLKQTASAKADSIKSPGKVKSKSMAKPDSVWTSHVDSALVSINARLNKEEEINEKQYAAITALTVDVDWLVKERAIDYSKAKNNGNIVIDDVAEFIKSTPDGRRLMWENPR